MVSVDEAGFVSVSSTLAVEAGLKTWSLLCWTSFSTDVALFNNEAASLTSGLTADFSSSSKIIAREQDLGESSLGLVDEVVGDSFVYFKNSRSI